MNYLHIWNIGKSGIVIIIFSIIMLVISCSTKSIGNKIIIAKNFEEVTIDFPKSFEIVKKVSKIDNMDLSSLILGVFNDDNMVFYDRYLNLIMKFDYYGNLLTQRELLKGKGPGEIDGFVHSIRQFNRDGYIITCFSRIILLDKELNHISTYAINFQTKDAFDIGNGKIVVCGYNSQNHKLFHIYDYECNYQSSFGKPFIEKNKKAEIYSMYCQPYYYYENYVFASSIFSYKIGAYNIRGNCNYIFDGNMDIENRFINGSINIHMLSMFAENKKLYLSLIDYKEGKLYLDIWDLERRALDKRVLFKNDMGYLVYKNKDKYIFLSGSGFFIAKTTKDIIH